MSLPRKPITEISQRHLDRLIASETSVSCQLLSSCSLPNEIPGPSHAVDIENIHETPDNLSVHTSGFERDEHSDQLYDVTNSSIRTTDESNSSDISGDISETSSRSDIR